MAATVTLSSKFQISIPKSVREQQGWKARQEFVFISKGRGVLLMPIPQLKKLSGIAKGASPDGYPIGDTSGGCFTALTCDPWTTRLA